ncbi:hypothetical protein [Candidatus Avelusimicrobium sp.]|uniref:hypothetical protein n=1 Tax=Candidatus Avelusimicrobium sp. TaxID=3048833 RepID=UPI003D7C3CF6
MEKNKKLLQLGFIIIVLLALGLAFMKTTGAGSASRRTAGTRQAAVPRQPTLEELKNEEFLGVAPSGQVAGRYQNAPQQKTHRQGNTYYPASNAPQTGLNQGDYTLRAPTVNKPYSGSYSGSGAPYMGQTMPANYGSYRAGVPGNTVSGGTNNSAAPGVYQPTREEALRRERANAFAPYLAGANKDKQKQLSKQLETLSSGLDRAIAKALLPKSKKDANIEKYLQRNSSRGVSAGPFAPVLDQVAAQKDSVVQSMTQAYGKQAGAQAGRMMDSFQKEMASAVNAPGQTQQQIANKVREVANKYQQKLEKMSQDNGFRQFEQERLTKDNQLKEALAKQYGSQIAGEAAQAIDAARAKDMQLARQGLPAEEYYKQQLENQRVRRGEIEKVIHQHQMPLDGLRKIEDGMQMEEVQRQLADEEGGKVLPRKHKMTDAQLNAVRGDLQQQRSSLVGNAQQIYGEAGAREIDALLQKYQQDYMELANNQEISAAEFDKKAMELRLKVNQDIQARQDSPQMKEARVNKQVDAIMRDPSVAQLPAEQKQALRSHAHDVLAATFEKIDKINASNLSNAEKQKQIQQAQAEAQRQLSGQ